jgi:transcription antitermination factor NusG
MLDLTKRWFAVYTRSRHEKRVAEILEQKQVTCYLPLEKTLKQWSDRKKLIEVPLFRGYVFVKVNVADYLLVTQTPGVVSYVTIGNKKISIPDVQIEAVRTYLGEQVLENGLEYFEVGNEIEVAYGVLKGLRGKLVSARDLRKLIVVIDAINQNITLTLPANLVRNIRQPSPKS